MKRTIATLLGILALFTGCAYGPDHLPALYAQRDHFQRIIDPIVAKMATDKEWWASLTPERRLYWKTFLEKVRMEERERALNAIHSITEGLSTREGNETGQIVQQDQGSKT